MRLELLKDLTLCAAFALLLWMPLGRWILARIAGEEFPVCRSLSLAVGMASWGILVLVLGLTGILHLPFVIGSALALFFLLGLLHHLWVKNADYSKNSNLGWSAGILLALFWGLSLVYFGIALGSALAPELSFDALNVHLPYARDAATSHRLEFVPNNWSSSMPALPLMNYVTAFVLSGVTLAKLFNALCYFTCGGVIYFFARRRSDPIHATAAALLFWSSPIALYEATTALIDLPLALYSAVAILSLLDWTASEDRRFLWLSAVSLGFALGCKYHAAFWLFPAAVIVIWHGAKIQGLRQTLLMVLRYLAIVMALFAPWFVRAWYYTGNPVFPVANGIFKSPYFTPAMERAARAAYENEGVGRSLPALIKLPWTVSFHPGPFRGTVGAIFLLGVVLALMRKKPPQLRYALLLTGVYFYCWALTAQEIRYLLPLVPLLAIVTAFGVLGQSPVSLSSVSAARPSRSSVPSRALSYAGLCVILAAATTSLPALYPQWVQEWTYWHSYKSPLRYLVGNESAQEYLSRDVPSIYVYDFINERLTPEDRILLLNDASQFYSRVPTLYSFTVEGDGLLLEETEAGVLHKLKESRITHVLLNYNGLAPLPGVAPRQGVYFFLEQRFQEKYLESVYSRNNVVLYRVRIS